MKFGDLKTGSKVYVLHSNNTLETETIDRISSHNGFIQMGFSTTDLNVQADSTKSIYFDEEADVTLFTEKHNLTSGEIEE